MLRPGPLDRPSLPVPQPPQDRIKILYFDRDGLAIWYKRLEAGSFQLPQAGAADGVELQPAQLAMLLSERPAHGATRSDSSRRLSRKNPEIF
jgi:transposase